MSSHIEGNVIVGRLTLDRLKQPKSFSFFLVNINCVSINHDRLIEAVPVYIPDIYTPETP